MNKFKSFTIMLGVLLLAFTMSCTKQDPQENPQNGQFSPGKKIHKIYLSYVDNDEKRLLETWHWNGDKLESIDYYGYSYDDDGTSTFQIMDVEKFIYDGNRLIRIDHEHESVRYLTSLFKYDNGLVTSVDRYSISSSDTLEHFTYTLYYQDGKLSVVDQKSSNSQSIVDVRLTWEGDNLVRLVYNGDENNGYWFEYDTKNNPMYGRNSVYYTRCLVGNWDDYLGPFVSKNNCTMLKEDMHKDGTYNMYYIYDEDDYPIRQARGTKFFHYEYE